MDGVPSTLYVSEISRAEFGDLGEEISSWLVATQGKKGQASDKGEDLPVFFDLEIVLGGVKRKLSNAIEANVLCCYSSTLSIEAVATYSLKDDKVKLDWLATNPKNIKHPLNDLTQRVSGAATKIMEHIGAIALKRPTCVIVNPLETTNSFYKKFGFVAEGDDDFELTMTWEVGAIETFLHRV